MIDRRPRGLLMLPLLMLATAAHAGTLTAGGGVGYDDNINQASASAQRRDSVSSRLHIAWQDEYGTSGRPRWLLRARGEAVDVARASGLSRLAADLQAGVLWRRGRSFSAPTLGVLLSAGHDAYASAQRDASWSRARALLFSQWTTRLALRGGLTASSRWAADPVFDQTRWGIEAGIDWLAAPQRRVYLDLTASDGESTVLAIPPAPVAMRARGIVADDVFAGFNAYRVDAREATATLGVSQRLTAMLTLRAQLQATTLRADGGSRYDRQAAELGLIFAWR